MHPPWYSGVNTTPREHAQFLYLALHKDGPKDLVQTAGANNNHGYVVPSDWSLANAVDVYTVRSLDTLLPDLVPRRAGPAASTTSAGTPHDRPSPASSSRWN